MQKPALLIRATTISDEVQSLASPRPLIHSFIHWKFLYDKATTAVLARLDSLLVLTLFP
jgi:hypothetical protein